MGPSIVKDTRINRTRLAVFPKVVLPAMPAPLKGAHSTRHMWAAMSLLDFQLAHWTERNAVFGILAAKFLQKGFFTGHSIAMPRLNALKTRLCIAASTVEGLVIKRLSIQFPAALVAIAQQRMTILDLVITPSIYLG